VRNLVADAVRAATGQLVIEWSLHQTLYWTSFGSCILFSNPRHFRLQMRQISYMCRTQSKKLFELIHGIEQIIDDRARIDSE